MLAPVGLDWTGPAIQGILFALFAGLTAILAAVLGPTYDGLLVPELDPSSLYPTLGGSSGGFFGPASALSRYVVVQLVDPAIPLVVLAIGILYLARSAVPQLSAKTQALVPKLVLSVLLANFSLPIAGAILGLAGAGYPALAGFDGGAWRHWINLGGFGMIRFSWDNGLLTFLLTFVLFGLVLLLAAAVAVRDALLAVLVVLLPIFTLVYPIPSLAPLARRGWMLFGQLAFLPWITIIPLELAVGSGSPLILVGYLTVALAAPGLLSAGGAHLTAAGFPSAGPALSGGIQRGQLVASSGGGRLFAPSLTPRGAGTGAGAALRSATRAASAAPLPATLPFFAGELAGHGLLRLLRHLPAVGGAGRVSHRFPPVRDPRGRVP